MADKKQDKLSLDMNMTRRNFVGGSVLGTGSLLLATEAFGLLRQAKADQVSANKGSEWVQVGELAEGFASDANILDFVDDLAGRTIDIHMDNGWVIRHVFESGDTLHWEVIKGVGVGEKSTESYTATRIRDNIYFVDFIKANERATSISLALNMTTGNAIALNVYNKVQEFAIHNLQATDLPTVNEQQCSKWYRKYGGQHGLIQRILKDAPLSDECKSCLAFYFDGLYKQQLTQYLPEDLAYDKVPEIHLEFLHTLSKVSTMVLISYRYQNQFEFMRSIEQLNLCQQGLFGLTNAFSVGKPGSSSDGSKSRFVSSKWRYEIRAQRRLTAANGQTFSPIAVGDSIRDIHFAIDIGGVFFGVSDTGEASAEILLAEFEKQKEQLHIRSRVFATLADNELQRHLLEECEAYMTEIAAFQDKSHDIGLG